MTNCGSSRRGTSGIGGVVGIDLLGSDSSVSADSSVAMIISGADASSVPEELLANDFELLADELEELLEEDFNFFIVFFGFDFFFSDVG